MRLGARRVLPPAVAHGAERRAEAMLNRLGCVLASRAVRMESFGSVVGRAVRAAQHVQ